GVRHQGQPQGNLARQQRRPALLQADLLTCGPAVSRRGAIWIRVSTSRQDETSQVPDIERFAAHHGIEIVKRYELNDVSAYKGEQSAKLAEAIADAWAGHFEVLIVWHSDRIERRGIERLLRLMRKLRDAGAPLMSVKEPWIDGSDDGPMSEMMTAMAATQARQESAHKSERIKMGMDKRRAMLKAGKEVKGRQAMGGRVKGSKNRQPRPELTGEAAGWTPERSAAQAERNKAMEWTPEQRAKIAASNKARAAAALAERRARCNYEPYPTKRAAVAEARAEVSEAQAVGVTHATWRCDNCRAWHFEVGPWWTVSHSKV
ncbi:MAG: recombinase family protein, partial [bacterium]